MRKGKSVLERTDLPLSLIVAGSDRGAGQKSGAWSKGATGRRPASRVRYPTRRAPL